MSDYSGAGLFTTTSRETAAKARAFRHFAGMRRRAGKLRTACIMTLYETVYNVIVSNPPHQNNVILQAGKMSEYTVAEVFPVAIYVFLGRQGKGRYGKLSMDN